MNRHYSHENETMSKLYALTAGDQAVIRKSLQTGNINWFLNFYLRSPGSGTYWRPVTGEQLARLHFREFREEAERRQEQYGRLYDVWTRLGQPEHWGLVENAWQALSEDEYEPLGGEFNIFRTLIEFTQPDPVFHNNHGFVLLPWQLEMHNAPQFEVVVAGGFGSGKTLANVARFLYHAAVLRGYRGFALAPGSLQSEEFYQLAVGLLDQTPYAERFLLKSPMRPRPTLVIGNDHVGLTRIECIPVAQEPEKARTVTGDECVIDQAEKFDQPVLDELRRSMGTRFRGQMHGRQKVGRTTYLANSGDNEALWSLFDESELYPEDVWAMSPPTVLNTYLGVDDYIRFERVVGRDEESQGMYLQGKRPMGSGEHFSALMLREFRDKEWAREIHSKSEEPVPKFDGEHTPTMGWRWKEAYKIGCYLFETPPQPGHKYVLAADLGWSDPPARNSAAISVWDVTHFPHAPARMVAFEWVFSGGDPNKMLEHIYTWVVQYHCIGQGGFDATGVQSGYDKIADSPLTGLELTPFQFTTTAKYGSLNLMRLWMRRGLLKAPYIPGLFNQCARYVIPDERIPQDLVMMLIVLGAVLEYYWYAVYGPDGEKIADDEPELRPDSSDRYARPAEARFQGHSRW